MPYFDKTDTYVNPYYLDVSPLVRQEMYTRAQYYSSYTKTAINEPTHRGLSNSVEWPYQKMPWAYVISQNVQEGTGYPIVLGFDLSEKDGIKQNSDKDGILTLYESVRNVPRYPLLTSLEISNEGLRGSLLKGKFTFTFFPDMSIDGFDLLSIQKIFFTPGNRVNIGFGWSKAAMNIEVNQLEFVGVIFGFNWNFNQNYSITAEVQIVSPSSLSVGLSGEQTFFEQEEGSEDVLDPTGKKLPPKADLLSIIQRDIRNENELQQIMQVGAVKFIPKENTFSNIFDYWQLGLPVSYGSSFEESSVERLRETETEQKQREEKEEEQAIQEAFNNSDIQKYDPSLDPTGTGQNIIPSDEVAGKMNAQKTPGNNNNQAGSFQMYMFLQAFIANKQDLNVETANWLEPWTTKFGGTSFGRYIWPDNSTDFNSGYWESDAQKSFSDFFTELTNTPENDRVEYINKQIAVLAIQELEELKNAMFYSRDPQTMQLRGGIGRGNAKIQFFWASASQKNVQKDDYFWPDALTISLSKSDGNNYRSIDIKSLYDTFNSYPQTKNLREQYKNDEVGLLKAFHDPLHRTNGADQIEKRINSYLILLKNYIGNLKTERLEKKEGGSDDEIEDKNPPVAVTKEHKDRMDKQIKELTQFQSAFSIKVFYNDGNEELKKFEKQYPNDKIVGGIDVKTLKDNMLLDFKSDEKNPKLLASKKLTHVAQFLNKLIKEREKEKENGKDTAKDLLKIKSTKYKDILNSKPKENDNQNNNDKKGSNSDSNTGDDGNAAQQYQPQMIGRTYRYISLANLAQFANNLLEQFEKDFDEENFFNYRKFRIQCANNETEYQPDIKSANPINVYFPDISMGGYYTFNPFYEEPFSDFLREFYIPDDFKDIRSGTNIKKIKKKIGKDEKEVNVRIEDDVINIGNILIGIDLIITAYRQFILDNTTNVAYKNITSLFDYIIREINACSGDTYQLSVQLFTEPEKLSPIIRLPEQIGKTVGESALLSIEDSNISRKHSQTYPAEEMNESQYARDFNLYAPNIEEDSVYDLTTVIPFTFEGNVFKPLIRNLNVVSRPPKELAYAAYVDARGREASEKGATSEDFRKKKSKPYSGDANITNPRHRDEEAYKKAREQNNIDKKNEEELVSSEGFNERWSDQYRSLLVKYKRVATSGTYTSGRGFPVGAHWLNKAIYPVDFNITIDGINGFKFGDVLKTTLIPFHYNVNWDMVFTVTKILHKVTPSSWETTLYTAARLSLDGVPDADKQLEPPKDGPDAYQKRAPTRRTGDEGFIGEGSTSGTSGEGSTAGTSGEGSTAGTSGEGSTAGTSGEGSTSGANGTDVNTIPKRDDLEYMRYYPENFDGPERVPDNFG